MHVTTPAAAPTPVAARSAPAARPGQPQSATHLYAIQRRREPFAQLLAHALRHRGGRWPLSSFSAFGEGLHMLEKGESPYLTRRAFLRSLEYSVGTQHPDFEHAALLVRKLDAADASYLGVAA